MRPNPAGAEQAPLAFNNAEPGAVRDKTEHTIRQLLAALPAPGYDIGVLTDKEMYRVEAAPASRVLRMLPFPKHRNAHGAHTRSPIFAVLPEQSSPKLTPSAPDCSRSSKRQKLNAPPCVSASQPVPSAGTPRPSRSHASAGRRTTMDGQPPQIWPFASPPWLRAGPSPTLPPHSAANTSLATPAAPAKPPTYGGRFQKRSVGHPENRAGESPSDSPQPSFRSGLLAP